MTTMLLYRKCREAGVKVILVGEGTDELFGGYPSYAIAALVGAAALTFLRRTLRLYHWYSGRRWGRELWRFAHTIQVAVPRGGRRPLLGGATVRDPPSTSAPLQHEGGQGEHGGQR